MNVNQLQVVPAGRKVSRTFIHCSATDHPHHDNIDAIREMHTRPKPRGRGWSDVGYHFFIRKSGEIQVGRSIERIPAAQAGNNSGTIAICLSGLVLENFTDAQRESLVALCEKIQADFIGQMMTFHGHCEVSAKSCPVIPYRNWLHLDEQGVMLRTPPIQPPTAHKNIPVLQITDRGEAVMVLQGLINREIERTSTTDDGDELGLDGVFGQDTSRALAAAQISLGVEPTRIADFRTWVMLASDALGRIKK